MVLGLLAIAAIPTTIGTVEAINQNKRVQREAKRDAKFNIEIYCDSQSRKRDQVHGKSVMLRDNKACCHMYIGRPPASSSSSEAQEGHPFEGFYIHYPDENKQLGLVSMVSQDPPAMGWIYVDKDTLEVRYGNRTASREHVVGPWDWTDDELGVTLEGEERFVAVEERPNVWAVYFDRADDDQGLPKNKRILDVSLERKLLPQE